MKTLPLDERAQGSLVQVCNLYDPRPDARRFFDERMRAVVQRVRSARVEVRSHLVIPVVSPSLMLQGVNAQRWMVLLCLVSDPVYFA